MKLEQTAKCIRQCDSNRRTSQSRETGRKKRIETDVAKRPATFILLKMSNIYPINQIITFDEIALDYVIANLIDNCGIDNVVPNSIRKLNENDITYKTEYCKTLLTYLNKHFNQREIAQALHINRSSLIYRLEKIKNNFNLDLCNEKDFLLFHLGLIMLIRDDI